MAGDDASAGPEEPEVAAGYDFAFDNKAFSDKLLRIEVVGSSEDAPQSGANAASRKRRRQHTQGDDGEGINSSHTVMGTTAILRVNAIYVNSAILAEKSPFFLKLFSNGMKESDQRHATIRIAESEEDAFMELLRFMYTGKLTPTTESALLVDILMASDKFEVISCMKLCGQRLISLPMTAESAVLCLDLPSSILVPAGLTESAKKFLVKRYKQFLSIKFQDELMKVPLPGIVAILSSNRPGVESQEAVYEFVLRWADYRYPNLEERRKILSSSLLPLVPQLCNTTSAIQLDQPSCIVDFTLKRELCSMLRLFPSRGIRSPAFHCAGHSFFLLAFRSVEPTDIFCVSIRKLDDKGSVRGTIDYKIEVKRRPLLASVTKEKTSTTDSGEAIIGFAAPWPGLIADDSSYFIDDKLHLRVHVKIEPLPS